MPPSRNTQTVACDGRTPRTRNTSSSRTRNTSSSRTRNTRTRNTPNFHPFPPPDDIDRHPKESKDTTQEEPRKSWRFWTIPNMLSIARLLMLAPTIWALVTQRNLLAFILFVVSSATDALDGWVARKFDQESEWGKILDPLADKLTLNSLAMIMAFQGRIPLFLALVVLVRDSVIVGGGIVLLSTKTFIPQSNIPGKIAGLSFFAMLCAGLLNVRWLLDGFLVPVVTVLVFITIVIYTYSFSKKILTKSRKEVKIEHTGNNRPAR